MAPIPAPDVLEIFVKSQSFICKTCPADFMADPSFPSFVMFVNEHP